MGRGSSWHTFTGDGVTTDFTLNASNGFPKQPDTNYQPYVNVVYTGGVGGFPAGWYISAMSKTVLTVTFATAPGNGVQFTIYWCLF